MEPHFLLLLLLLLLPPIECLSATPGTYFKLQHRYSGAHGSIKSSQGRGASVDHLRRLIHHDRTRHARFLASVASFPLGGIADPNVAGLYFTEIHLGTPPSKYYVQVDTGSDLLWLNCASCSTCPKSTDLGVRLMLYDPETSSSSNIVNCGEEFCSLTSSHCMNGDVCYYQLGYGDGSSSRGYFVEDKLQLDFVAGTRTINSANATVAFGCGITQTGELQQQEQALDGIMGFGQSKLSVIQQLVARGDTAGIFAHCLEGEGSGGGILVIGNVQEPGLVYTSILPNQIHYNVNLENIVINGQGLKIDSSTDPRGEISGSIIDSGTTLAYITEPTYGRLIKAIIDAGPKDLATIPLEGMTCLIYKGSLDRAFPTLTFVFAGGNATMKVKPHEYFIPAQTNADDVWCIGFQSPTQNGLDLVILGDLVLKNKLVVYDLEKQRIGWVDYNCSSSVTVVTSNNETARVFASSINSSSSSTYRAWSLHGSSAVGILTLMCIIMLL